jgi:DnaK suppressor protein
MPQLAKEQLKELKGLLTEEKEELTAHFEINDDSSGDFDDSLKTSTGELSSYDNHPGDLGTETFEKSRDMALDETLNGRLDEVNRALELMKTGAYGKCEVCGKDIPFERLQALPSATRCIEDTADTGLSNDRPVEEQVMTPPPSGAGEHRQENAGHFDEADAWSTLEEYGNASDTVKG